ncbi:polysaccharide pyruvyl transferase CsaB [Aerococcus viridans]|uniref:Polysaccharide pyruvyl transferase domain-containing protein n=2 Tax=Aerococcus viridans TaxID=1377 RepID=A0AAU8U4C7_9LACT|nr:polysaccharide pyruvyl transferase family protein [Aerococcus viridans]AMC01367.1 hypothetical protein AWM76_07295 [Aerococcus viridans]EFG50324.1 hypothetical protein HMPREF0061_0330 [Aerococcus viridans ATCC 11563 = CCUG 4311]SUU15758.1 polysaccharide pyruvyl transferase CsaB [Aerococcus viridans]
MKKIAILTINDYNNYGNRLQNYALQEVLKKQNFEVETIKNYTNFNYLYQQKSGIIERITNFLKNSPMENFRRLYVKLNKIEKNKSEQLSPSDKEAIILKRRKYFLEFTHNYIKESFFTISEQELELNKLKNYDFYITGSDQVWNTNYRDGSFIDFLTFAPKEKRISYAASFGISEVPKAYHANFSKWLKEMAFISVREKDGARIVKELSGRDATVSVDPTMLLHRDEWLSISKKAANRPECSYILTYFLGGPNNEVKELIDKLSIQNNLKIINLGVISEVDTYTTGPSEFLDYINNASLFLTDSFHGVVFSIIFKTPFVVYERKGKNSMFSRINTILENFNLQSRSEKHFDGNWFETDFSDTDNLLEIEYKNSLNYLNKALKIEE